MHTRLGIKAAYKVPGLADRWVLSDNDDGGGGGGGGASCPRMTYQGFCLVSTLYLVSCDGSDTGLIVQSPYEDSLTRELLTAHVTDPSAVEN